MLDRALVFLSLALAFLVASFAVRNSDFWQHLAAGRLLAAGEYRFGADPFSFTAREVYWVNHAWLFDLGLYFAHETLDGVGVVVLKALGVTLLAWLLMRFRQPNGPIDTVVVCTVLALIAMSPRLLVQPVLASLLLLAGSLSLLHRGGRRVWLVIPLVALWVNLDAWFLLGPLVVTVFWLTGRLERPADAGRHLPDLLVPACLLACLANPHHVRAFAWPTELSPAVWRSALRDDVRFSNLFASSWEQLPRQLTAEVNLAAWGFVSLLGLGLVSFLHGPARRDWRLPLWLLFAAGALWQARLVPLFTVVAAPITALNLQGLLAGRRLPGPVRLGLAAGCLALAGLCWPGWLQGIGRQDRPMAWAVQPDPSLVRAAGTVKRWRDEGRLDPEARLFATHPDVAHYLAWFAPGERCFLDARFTLFVGVADDHECLCRLLLPGLTPDREGREGGPAAGLAAFRRYRMGGAILHDPNRQRLGLALRQVVLATQRWDLLRVDGRALIVGLRASPYRPRDVEAFDPARPGYVGGGGGWIVPDAGPATVPEEKADWRRWLERPGARPPGWQSEAAAVYLRLFEDAAGAQTRRQSQRVIARWAGTLVGLPALPAGVARAVSPAAVLTLPTVSLPDLHKRPPGLPLLSVQAARAGLADSADDAHAWLVLGEAYYQLWQKTAEAMAQRTLPPWSMVRYIQIATALKAALAIDPDLPSAHAALGTLYRGRDYLDLAYHHRASELRLLRRLAPPPGAAAAHADRLERLAGLVEELERTVQDRQGRFDVQTEPLSDNPLARARIALDLGLPGKALDVLLRSRVELFGVEGARLQIELLLTTGQVEEAQRLMDEAPLVDNRSALGVFEIPGGPTWTYRLPAYEWFEVCLGAASGRYDRAHSGLGRIQAQLRPQAEGGLALARLRAGQILAAEVGLGAVGGGWFARLAARREREQLTALFTAGVLVPVVQADLDVVAGLLRLEQGDTRLAAAALDQALAGYRSVEAFAPSLPGRPLAVEYRSLLAVARPPSGGGR